jgi:long-chain acyl-CoA synthetase
MSELRIIFGNAEISGADLDDRSARAASALAAGGVNAGDRVAVLLRNEPVLLELMKAADCIGAAMVPINWHLAPAEVNYLVRDSGARMLIAHSDLLAPCLDGMPPGVSMLQVSTPEPILSAYDIAASAQTISGVAKYEERIAKQSPWAGPPVAAPGSVIYTSGTTGLPKGVLRHIGPPERVQAFYRARRVLSAARPGMRTAVVGPLYHAAPNSSARVALDASEVLVLFARFNPIALLEAIERWRLTHLSLVPVMLVRLLQVPADVRQRFDLSSLEFVTHGGAPCPPVVKRQIIDWWGPILHETYGSTEAGLVTRATSLECLARPGTVGRPFDGVSIRILDEEGRELPPGQTGEIYINQGANWLDFEYLNHPEMRQACERDGYITNGDVGHLDSDGYLFITDRRRDMVISGGVNIYPAEIEGVLMECPGIADCAVFGVPDDEFGESVAAAVQWQPGRAMEAPLLQQWLRQHIAGYKVPRLIEVHELLPRDAMGKIHKHRLREPHWRGLDRRI